MKTGVIGVGSMGQNHARIYRDLGVLACVCDTDWDKSKQTAYKYGVTNLSLSELLASKIDIDAVSIATPTPYHVDIAKACIRNGINVLIEKPMAPGLDDALELINVQRNTGVIATVGYIERYNPVFRELQRRVQNKAFGEITSVNIKRVGGIPRSADNVVMDVMTHDIDLLTKLFNKLPANAHCHKRESGKIVHSAQALLDFGDASATCEANWVSPDKVRVINLTGTENCAEVDLIKQTIKQYKLGYTTIEMFKGEPLKAEIQSFCKAVQTQDDKEIMSLQEAYNTLKITTKVANAYKEQERMEIINE